MSFTPGPWHVSHPPTDEGLVILGPRSEDKFAAVVATVHGPYRGEIDQNTSDDARLIAAAPLLLASLEEMVGERPAHEWSAVYERAHAAIAAALPPTESPTCTGMFPEEEKP
jgi:hypothetical protein